MSEYAEIIQRALNRYNDCFEQVKLSQINNASGYDTIVIFSDMTEYRPKIDGALFARIKESGKNPYVSIKYKYKFWFDERGIPTFSIKSETDFIRVSAMDFWSAVHRYDEEFGKLAATICLDSMSFPKFGCCSRYKECSNVGKCIHNDVLYSSACEYRHNLEAGRIFYGE